MSCPEIQDQVQRLLDGGSANGDRAALEEHLRLCAECRELVDAAVRLQEGLRRTPAIPVPAGFADRVVQAVQWDSRRTVRLTRRYLAVAALVLIAGLAVWAAVMIIGGNKGPGVPDDLGKIQPTKPALPDPPVPDLRDDLNKMPGAIAQLTGDVTRDAREILPPLDAIPTPPMPSWPSLPDVPVERVTQTVTSGLEPMTTAFERAGGMFLRVVPNMDEAKSGL